MNLVNDSDHVVIVDSILDTLIDGEMFEEIYWFFFMDSFWMENEYLDYYTVSHFYKDQFCFFKYYVKDGIVIFKYSSYHDEKIKLPSHSHRKIDRLETGSGIYATFLSKSQNSEALNGIHNLDYTVKLQIYANDNTCDTVIMREYNLIYDGIKSPKLIHLRVNKDFSNLKLIFDISGRNVKYSILPSGSNFFIKGDKENRFKGYPILNGR